MSGSGTGAAESAAERAAQVLAPEAGLLPGLGDADPALFGRALTRAMVGAARHPRAVSRAWLRCGAGLAEGALATAARSVGVKVPSRLEAVGDDKRFSDPTWEENAFFFGIRQAYVAWTQLLDDLIDAAGLDSATTTTKASFAARFVADASSPTNFLPTNPVALKRAFETGGLSVLRGMRNFADDVVHNNGRPKQVDSTAFRVGDNLAATPGQVVYRSRLMELIQYAPQTDTVHEVPILCSPPWINKYYVMDLAPGRSFVEWAVTHGHTVFAISYRNPDETLRDVTLDDYLVEGPRTALDVINDVTGHRKVNIVGLCLGGTLTAMLAAHLSAGGDDRLHTMTLLNTLLDYSEPGALGVFTDVATIERLERRMRRRGYLQGGDMAGTFDALRANDLIFNYVASNWLMGEKPPSFDILTWNADSTRMPAQMHSFYLRSLYLNNELARGNLELQGQRLSLSDVHCDTYLVAAENDHIVPWRSSYRSTQLLAGDVRYVLSSAGHIAGIVNPPSKKARYSVGEQSPDDPERWREAATEHQGSWWEDWAVWIADRAGEQREPPPMGSEAHPPLDPAPGRYVHG